MHDSYRIVAYVMSSIFLCAGLLAVVCPPYFMCMTVIGLLPMLCPPYFMYRIVGYGVSSIFHVHDSHRIVANGMSSIFSTLGSDRIVEFLTSVKSSSSMDTKISFIPE